MAKYLDQTGLTYFWGKVKGWVNNSQHPVNSLYLTVGTEDPAKLFGGTWEKITGGYMLCATETDAGKTGGHSTVTLTPSNLPSHSHSYTKATGINNTSISNNQMPSHNHGTGRSGFYEAGRGDWGLAGGGAFSDSILMTRGNSGSTYYSGGGAGHGHSLNTSSASTGNTGDAEEFDITPPKINVYVWKRTE